MRSSGKTVRRMLPFVLLALVSLAGFALLGDDLGLEAFSRNREVLLELRDAHPILTVAGFIGLYAALVALSVPASFILTVAAGFLFGLIGGTLLSLVASTAGATAIFLAARAGLGERLRARWRTGETYARIEAGLKRHELSYLLLLRLFPAVPFPVANVAPALFGVSAGRFAATTFLGIAPGTALTAWIGVGLGEVLARGEAPDLSILRDPAVAAPLAAFALLAALPIFVGRLRPGKGGRL